MLLVDLPRRAVRRDLARQQGLSAALATITAAVVGVVLNLAVWFALHVLFAEVREVPVLGLTLDVPVLASVNLASLVLTLAALLAVSGSRSA